MSSIIEEQQFFERLVKSSINGIIAFDQNGFVLMVNDAFCQLLRYAPDELTGTAITSIFPDLTYEFDYIAGKTIEIEGIGKTGTPLPFAFSTSKVLMDKTVVYTCVLQDATAFRQIEFELIDNQHKLDSIINLAVDGIISIDEKGIIEMVNPAAAKLFGYKQEEITGKNIKMLMPEPDKSQHDQYMKNYHRTGVGKIIGIGREVLGLKKNGEVFPFKLSISEIFLRNRRIYTGIIHDLSAQKKAEEELRHLNQELEIRVEQRTVELKKATEKIRKALEKEKELSELKSRFVSMASHEFRTPLSTILSSVGLMSRYVQANETAKLQKHLDRIHGSVNHLKHILDDFLSLSKLEEGRVGIKPEVFDLKSFVEGVIENMRLVSKPGQTIDDHYPESNIQVTLDKTALETILTNLLSNAIKYSDEKSLILISVSLDRDMVEISVKDEGIGIPEVEQNHLFERFFRAKNATNIQGTGLGLHIVKRHIDLLQGSIHCESKEYVGTTVMVKLPLHLSS